ncbi:DNA-directed RNA polymerase subunit alpha C-terminal domain-containing protein [Peribacillus frigoritolerans]|uniref:DNA-directed RNA polymerase subunit alpha C-terminal domain-containing protein n=1 Tax=Peribacillus frigoritolerans TaxID=450367 RepID=UPI002EA7BDD7|nr:DNA-directed RNA polymerase subunit alpha C-terminal domain-containing protein [Peribacillus frigoritolerans]
MITNQSAVFNQFKSSLDKAIAQSGMTFNPSIDCRNDLVNHYGYSHDQVNTMSDDELFCIMEKLEGIEPSIPYQCDTCHKTEEHWCGDCEVFHCECGCGEHHEEVNQEATGEKVDARSLSDIEMELSIRSYNCLVRAGYKTVQQVKVASLSDMNKVRNLGTRSLQEIEEVLDVKFS